MQEKKMKFIELTLKADDIKIICNVEMIGHFYREKNYTDICLLTNNNGGMKVKESVNEIIQLINN